MGTHPPAGGVRGPCERTASSPISLQGRAGALAAGHTPPHLAVAPLDLAVDAAGGRAGRDSPAQRREVEMDL